MTTFLREEQKFEHLYSSLQVDKLPVPPRPCESWLRSVCRSRNATPFDLQLLRYRGQHAWRAASGTSPDGTFTCVLKLLPMTRSKTHGRSHAETYRQSCQVEPNLWTWNGSVVKKEPRCVRRLLRSHGIHFCQKSDPYWLEVQIKQTTIDEWTQIPGADHLLWQYSCRSANTNPQL